VAPHLHGVALDAEALGDVVGADRIASLRGHVPIMPCNARVDKCNGRRYNRTMTNDVAPFCCIDHDGTGLWCESCLAYWEGDVEARRGA
jgi:hypothetical protein